MHSFSARVPFSVERYYEARRWCAEQIRDGWEFAGFCSAAVMEFVFRSEAEAARFEACWASSDESIPEAA